MHLRTLGPTWRQLLNAIILDENRWNDKRCPIYLLSNHLCNNDACGHRVDCIQVELWHWIVYRFLCFHKETKRLRRSSPDKILKQAMLQCQSMYFVCLEKFLVARNGSLGSNRGSGLQSRGQLFYLRLATWLYVVLQRTFIESFWMFRWGKQ